MREREDKNLSREWYRRLTQSSGLREDELKKLAESLFDLSVEVGVIEFEADRLRTKMNRIYGECSD